jgi:hypothetical protein
MRHVELFENFDNWVKKYGEKITMNDFKALMPGQHVKYIGTDYEIVKVGDVLVLKSEDGSQMKVNYNMFNQRGAILKNTDETFEEFANTRGEGAAKIASNAQKKGGLALLTWHHFKVKAPYYKKATDGKFNVEAARKEFEDTLKRISLDMTPVEFQAEVGRLEVLGELLIETKTD